MLANDRIWQAPTNASKWHMEFNSAFKRLTDSTIVSRLIRINLQLRLNKYGGTKKRERSAWSSGRFVQVFTGQEAWWPQTPIGRCGEDKNPCSCQELNPDRPAYNPSLYRSISRFYWKVWEILGCVKGNMLSIWIIIKRGRQYLYNGVINETKWDWDNFRTWT